ncbi:CaiB/BaiF CoA transferase family protein [Bordetella pseudohinzii]|uniref:Carnitine dehydratase n=1 Tax=Bordetella pseudohinzii TaxID=1331258 RepID=A0A0J6C5H6_9BORD|nr:CoA transferase [Bordetella pseudohinzii]ANY14984.1 carnitine dehydratase [Bordetella pseudohinzii]KMM26016.1 carnitine dehydratase [Bordetella pseudohinzii]KXA75512.1 carnitine dehydratase [Bordetella pseudohinzii]KXA78842.1 carnitine dehydratase [Bordetella pseudohinzii]CUI95947.1 Formyl-coenzyme A transferase [Bordetella pseudohinzii]
MDTPLPLQGIRVLEFCNVAAGPYCGMLLADMGADLVKIEHPGGGDTLRAWPPINNGYSENFASLNRNKRSVTLDLKSPAGQAQARALAAEADVLLENNRPGVMQRLGLDYASLKAINPRLLYCSISAYGQSGPRAAEGGFDLTIQAMGGVMSVTGEADGAPVKCGVPLADFAAGLYAAFSIAASLRQVQQTGQGAHIDVPMLGTTLAIAALQTSEYFGSGKDPAKLGSAHPRNAPYQAFRCRDGYFAMAAGNDALWRSVCQVVQRPELLNDERFQSTTLRARNQAALRDLLETVFVTQDAAHWLRCFQEAGVPSAPINTYSQVLADPQVAHMQWVQEITLPGDHVTRTFTSPIKINGQGLPVRRNPPALGEHNAEILPETQA